MVKNIDNKINIDAISADFLLSFDIKLIIIPNAKELNDIYVVYKQNKIGWSFAY